MVTDFSLRTPPLARLRELPDATTKQISLSPPAWRVRRDRVRERTSFSVVA